MAAHYGACCPNAQSSIGLSDYLAPFRSDPAVPKSLVLLVGFFVASAGWQQSLPAQAAQSATLRLKMVDDETGDPVPGVIVRLKGRPDTTTGANGQMEITGLEPKSWKLELRAIGYDPRFETIALTANQVLNMRFGLSFTGEQLPEVVVSARRGKISPRYADFHRRMENHLGYYITWETIKQRGFTSIGETLRGVRGVYVDCRVTDCQISMSRSKGCEPSYWIDGIEGRSFATAVPIRDVYGIEVYRGAGETPGEYVSTGACGVIVIWTKSKPYR